MREEDARLALLQTELNAIQTSIGNMDTITFQIKGWCVTAALAIGGFAVVYRKPALLIVGIGAVLGFYLVDCQFKAVQRSFIRRNRALYADLKSTGIMPFLQGSGNVDVVGVALLEWSHVDPNRRKPIRYLAAILKEARTPSTFTLYFFILVSLIVELLIIA